MIILHAGIVGNGLALWGEVSETGLPERAFRIGEKRNVQVHKFVCAGLWKCGSNKMIEAKKDVAESVVGTGEAWLTELSNKEIREMLTLSREAMRE